MESLLHTREPSVTLLSMARLVWSGLPATLSQSAR